MSNESETSIGIPIETLRLHLNEATAMSVALQVHAEQVAVLSSQLKAQLGLIDSQIEKNKNPTSAKQGKNT